MAKIVFHIGTHKTATTTLQNIFWQNSELLATKGLIFPRLPYKLGGITGHHGLVYHWKHMPPPFKLEGGGKAALAGIAREYADQDVTVFLSSEEFSSASPYAKTDFNEVRGIFADFNEVEVICTLRTQWQFLQSVYLELSKKRIPQRPPTFVGPVIQSGRLGGLLIDYNMLLDQLEEAFAPEEITLFDFDTVRKTESGIIGHFLHHLGVDLDVTELVGSAVANVSPMALAGWVGNILAEPKTASPGLIDLAKTALEQEYVQAPETCLFTDNEFALLAKHFNEKNLELAKRRAAVQPGFSITPANDQDITLFRNDINGKFWIRMSRVLANEML